MRDLLDVQNFILQSDPEETLVLCTIVKKQGSSYRGLGAKKIVSATSSCGLLSGGGLEVAIEKSARERISEMPLIDSFNTLAEEDRLLGYQTGCQGVIDILFEVLPSRLTPGAQEKIDQALLFGEQERFAGVQVKLEGENLGQRIPLDPKSKIEEKVFIERWVKPVELIIIGCGADAPAYQSFAKALGWSLRFVDYRRDLARTEVFPGARVDCVPLKNLASVIPQGSTVAVVLMTHNYEADLEILRALRFHKLGYVGCHGSLSRFQRLQKDMFKFYGETIPSYFLDSVSAPAGMFPHSRSPSEVALSVVSEIQEKVIEERRAKTWTLVLASGQSKRFGSPKALATWRGQALLKIALATARKISNSRTLVVTGCYAEFLSPHLQDIHYVHNENWQQGVGSSIAKGVAAIRNIDAHAESIVILSVDQPLVEVAHVRKLCRISQLTKKCALTAGDQYMGPPAVLPSHLFELTELLLRADNGLKSILKPSDIVAIEDHKAARDYDSPEELRLLPQ